MSDDDPFDNEKVVPIRPGKRPRPPRTDWTKDWHQSENGTPLPNLFNVLLTLRNMPGLSAMLAFDHMAQRSCLMRQIPNTKHDTSIPRPVIDRDSIMIQEEIQRAGLRRVSRNTIDDAILARAHENGFHPVRDWLERLAWDSTPRLDTWLTYYLGAEPPEAADDDEKARIGRYHAMIGRLFLIAMVARIMRPGCQADYMLVLEGAQGVTKSSACRILAGEWYSGSLPELSRGDMVRISMHLRGKWLIEIAELQSFSKVEAQALKDFISRQTEEYIAKYARNEVREPRQCLLIGTTNESFYLRDPTGARRFWPVRCGTIDLDALTADRDQLFAEAMAAYRANEKWWPDPEFEAATIRPEQKARYQSDPWEEATVRWINENAIQRCTAGEVLRDAIGLTVAQSGTPQERRVTDVLKHLGWQMHRSNGVRWYVRPTHFSGNV